jgi:hypothetical protein
MKQYSEQICTHYFMNAILLQSSSLSLSLFAPLSRRHTPTHALFPSLSHPSSHPLSLFPLACLVAATIQQATTLSRVCALTYETFTYDRPRQFR